MKKGTAVKVLSWEDKITKTFPLVQQILDKHCQSVMKGLESHFTFQELTYSNTLPLSFFETTFGGKANPA